MFGRCKFILKNCKQTAENCKQTAENCKQTAENQNKCIPLKRILALPTMGQKCIVSEF